uniref:Putative secreted protein n=1 Tax=Anopheles triannulatus TaxID=58253 RepID=A0A2M4B1G4_9DIPT
MQFYLCFGLAVYASIAFPLLFKRVDAFVLTHYDLYDRFRELNISLATKIENFVNKHIDMEMNVIGAETLRKKKLRNGAHA